MVTPPKNSQPHGKRQLLAVITAAAVLLVAMMFARPTQLPTASTSRDEAEPDACASAMVSAEKDGDVEAYLDCFTGRLRDRLESRMAEKSREGRAAELRSGAADLTGHATTDVKITPPDEATLVLERIYTRHNERHQVTLRRVFGDWKIVAIKPLERFAPEIPYGTPVVPLQEKSQQEASQP